MKSIFKTVIVICVTLLLVVTAFLVKAKIDEKKVDKGTKLSTNDPVVSLLQAQINKNTELRLANLTFESLNGKDFITYALYALDDKEYEIKNYKSDSGLCVVPNSVMFSSNTNCSIKIMDENKIKELIKELFNKEPTLSTEEFEYKEYFCKYDSGFYYCLINNEYKNNTKYYTYLDEAYEKDDEIYLYEYYLNINLNNQAKCLKFYNSDICNNLGNVEIPELTKEKIKENGVLYKHTFAKEDNKYYLLKSEVVK